MFGGNKMNDIKLTDEATIDSLKEMAIKFSKDTYVNRVLVNAINLIHRLQSENKELRTESDRMVAEHLAFVELAKKANEQQKAEIAELKAQCSKSSYRDSWKNKFFKANEEIERLTEENGYLDGCAKQFLADYQKCEIDRAELQNQVNELTAFKNEAISMSLYGKGRKDGEAVAVKDTAKEILQEWADVDKETGGFNLSLIFEIAKSKGVEVE